jgi:hypothetical protein
VDQGGLIMGGRGQGLGHAPPIVWATSGPSLAPIWSPSFVRVKLEFPNLFRPIPRIFHV